MTRLYLVHRDRYRVRKLDASVVLCQWDDERRQFHTGRGDDWRVIPWDDIAALSSFVAEGRAAIQWFSLDCVYRAKCAPAGPTRTWVHPYARRAA